VITDCKESYIHSILSDMNQALLTNNIIVKDYISFKDLPEVYNLAELFLYPSLRESFGLPIIESMACGTPVITSNASSMPEVAGNAAILINPINSKEIGNAIKILLSDRAYYKSIVKMGIERASHFDWKVSAKKVIKIYHETKLNIN
ncbi:MAG: glycosyltransferase, partial [Cyclobacteriaceae bacterium]